MNRGSAPQDGTLADIGAHASPAVHRRASHPADDTRPSRRIATWHRISDIYK
ncbi:hypothetical protein BP1258A_3316 [Burkholderia pseudomallei 1258a]|nr:hypothetical protein BURPS305_7776 [Burkholderia pseudomallei 305]EDU06702.1 hypothetical protein BURPS1655_0521 [Burkholderia pseudomallei 1655]EEC32539.1 conserved hypothetical protein [Burkholderia pseudomallei 576]EEH27441.1 conserved hypothetical protein [Burkholderia pseudomallei Pakistan 9]EIF60421.1 hypothetical protein BP1258A_3316 [Burkholderia pseudomallei 1258a]EIF61049.1 hypothetical protein BP1258B_3694 [Burkholderia pseudomallei 1258b]